MIFTTLTKFSHCWSHFLLLFTYQSTAVFFSGSNSDVIIKDTSFMNNTAFLVRFDIISLFLLSTDLVIIWSSFTENLNLTKPHFRSNTCIIFLLLLFQTSALELSGINATIRNVQFVNNTGIEKRINEDVCISIKMPKSANDTFSFLIGTSSFLFVFFFFL